MFLLLGPGGGRDKAFFLFFFFIMQPVYKHFTQVLKSWLLHVAFPDAEMNLCGAAFTATLRLCLSE